MQRRANGGPLMEILYFLALLGLLTIFLLGVLVGYVLANMLAA